MLKSDAAGAKIEKAFARRNLKFQFKGLKLTGALRAGCYIGAMLRNSRGRPQHARRFHSALPSYGCRPTTERRWLGA